MCVSGFDIRIAAIDIAAFVSIICVIVVLACCYRHRFHALTHDFANHQLYVSTSACLFVSKIATKGVREFSEMLYNARASEAGSSRLKSTEITLTRFIYFMYNNMNMIHTHPFNGPFSGTTRVSQYQKGETNLDFTEAKDSEW